MRPWHCSTVGWWMEWRWRWCWLIPPERNLINASAPTSLTTTTWQKMAGKWQEHHWEPVSVFAWATAVKEHFALAALISSIMLCTLQSLVLQVGGWSHGDDWCAYSGIAVVVFCPVADAAFWLLQTLQTIGPHWARFYRLHIRVLLLSWHVNLKCSKKRTSFFPQILL